MFPESVSCPAVAAASAAVAVVQNHRRAKGIAAGIYFMIQCASP